MAKKQMTQAARRSQAIEGLREALHTTSIDYPYFGVPAAIRNALKVLVEDQRLDRRLDAEVCADADEQHNTLGTLKETK